jgi:hypothetical protein
MNLTYSIKLNMNISINNPPEGRAAGMEYAIRWISVVCPAHHRQVESLPSLTLD